MVKQKALEIYHYANCDIFFHKKTALGEAGHNNNYNTPFVIKSQPVDIPLQEELYGGYEF